MAKKSGNLLIKVAVLIAIAAAVFFGLDSWRKQSTGDQPGESAGSSARKSGLTRAEAERIGNEIGTRIGTEIGTRIGREVAQQMLAERESAVTVASADTTASAGEPAPEPVSLPEPVSEPEPQAESAAEPASEPGPEPAESVAVAETEVPAETDSDGISTEGKTGSPDAASRPARPRENRTQGTIPGTPVAQSTEGRDPWWIKSNTGEPNTLVLTYAGNFQASDGSQTGIALMFSGRFDGQTNFSDSISVTGGNISGQWQLGANRGLIYLPGVPKGSYTVTIKAGLTDADGNTLKKDVSGPVEVQ